jgi:predicted transcriptional regulator
MSTELSPDEDCCQEQTLEDIREGLASIERGEGTPLDEVVDTLRAKYGICEDA